MTDTRMTALRQGMGSIDAVASELSNLPATEDEIILSIRAIVVASAALRNYPGGAAILSALLCADQNKAMRKEGYLWATNDKGEISRQYVADDGVRNALADLAGL